MSILKEPDGVILSVEKRELTQKEKKLITEFINKRRKQNSSKRKNTLQSKVKFSK